METIKFTIDEQNAGKRIDKVIASQLGEDYSRTYVKNLIDGGMVTVDGNNVKPKYTAQVGDKVAAELAPTEIQDVEPEDIPLDIIYEDEALAVVNKSAGMVVHPGAGNMTGTLVNAMLHHSSRLADTGDMTRPGIVHRLDKDTSGGSI